MKLQVSHISPNLLMLELVHKGRQDKMSLHSLAGPKILFEAHDVLPWQCCFVA